MSFGTHACVPKFTLLSSNSRANRQTAGNSITPHILSSKAVYPRICILGTRRATVHVQCLPRFQAWRQMLKSTRRRPTWCIILPRATTLLNRWISMFGRYSTVSRKLVCPRQTYRDLIRTARSRTHASTKERRRS